MKSQLIIFLLFVCAPLYLSAQAYTYDQQNRLVKTQYANGQAIDYTYDQVGNRTTKLVNGVTSALPDLASLSSNLSATSVQASGTLTVTWNENNLGTTATSAACNAVVALSSDAAWHSGTDVQLATQTVATGFGAGASQAVTKTITIPAGTAAGQWYILVVSDAGSVINEISEQNNVQATAITVTANCSGMVVSFPTIKPDTCNNYKGSVLSSVSGGVGPYTYQWSTGSQAQHQEYILLAGTYTLTVTSANGCTTSGTATVSNIPQAMPSFTFTTNQFTANFTNTSINATSYLWNFGNGTTSTLANPSVTYASAGSYQVNLTASNASCPSINTTYLVVVSGNGCDVPTGLATSALTNTSATLIWNASAGATSYNLRLRAVGSSTWGAPVSTTATTYTFTGLTLGTAYEVQIEAVCTQGNSGYGQTYFFVSGGTPVSSDVFMLQMSNTSGYSSFFHDKAPGLSAHNYAFIQAFSPAVISMTQLSHDYSTTNWSKHFTTASLYAFADILTQEDGSIVMVATPEGVSYNGSFSVLKLNSSGAVVWFKSYYTPTNWTSGGFPKRIIKLSNGNVLIAGHLAEAQTSNLAYNAAFVMELNQSGALVWEKEYPYSPSNNTYSHWNSITELSDGYFAIGDVYSNISGSAFNRSFLYAIPSSERYAKFA